MADVSKRERASRPEEEEQEQEQYRDDLNPDFLAGMNVGTLGSHPEKSDFARTAFDLKDVHRKLQEFEDDELKQIVVLSPGTRLEQGATYVDLRGEHPREFSARADIVAGTNNWYVPKNEVPYQLWNRLIGVDNPERTGDASES